MFTARIKYALIPLFFVSILILAWVFFLSGPSNFFNRDSALDEEEVVQTHENLKVIKLSAVEGKSGDGIASKGFNGGVFSTSVAVNVNEPDIDKFYEAWLVKGDLPKEYFSLGKLENSEGKYIANFTDTKDFPDYNLIIVSMEPEANGLDNVMEIKILEGSF